MLNDYRLQAEVWDWDAYDDTPEYAYWCDYARPFGARVLVPMCAHGQTGAYMARHGFNVTAFDITPQMIEEGRKRYGGIPNLELTVADALNLELDMKAFDFAFIAGYGDLHLFQRAEDVARVFRSMHRHLRVGGCLALELTLPSDTSWQHPKAVFHPRVPRYTDKKVWKESQSAYNADEKRHYIDQTVYIEDDNGVRTFTQRVCLQYYDREVILKLLNDSGFAVKHEYGDRHHTPWSSGAADWLLEAIKV